MLLSPSFYRRYQSITITFSSRWIIGPKISLTFHTNLQLDSFEAFSINFLPDFQSSWPLFSLFLGTIHKHYLKGGGFVIFTGEIWDSPSSIGRIWVPPFWGLTEMGTPSIYNLLITPLYVFYGLIWATSIFLMISIWQNLGAPPSNKWQNLGTPSQKPQPQ